MLARQRFAELERIEKAYTAKADAPSPLDPRLKRYADDWVNKNKWYNPSGEDEDSSIMLTIDARMAKEGWDPNTESYWEELTRRGKKFLPHRFSAPKTTPRAVVGGSGKEASGVGAGSVKGFKLSPDRVQAIKDAGMWNDPTKRAEMIKRFRQFDKENGQG